MNDIGDYISREYVLKCMEDSYKSAGISAEAKAKMTRWLNKAPAADVQPVVVCADCEYNNHCLTQEFVDDCGKIPLDRNTFFCADGERRSNA